MAASGIPECDKNFRTILTKELRIIKLAFEILNVANNTYYGDNKKI